MSQLSSYIEIYDVEREKEKSRDSSNTRVFARRIAISIDSDRDGIESMRRIGGMPLA